MPPTVEKLPGEPIAIVTHYPPYKPDQDIVAAEHELAKILAEMQEPLFVITDYSGVDVSFNDLVMSLADASSRTEAASVRSDKIRLVLVGSSDLVELGASALAQEQYGSVQTPFFKSIDEALAYCRSA